MYRDLDREAVLRWWYLCDVCVMEAMAPWIKNKLPPLEEGQMWSSANGGRTYRRTASATSR